MSPEDPVILRIREALDAAMHRQEDPCAAARLCRIERAVVESLLHIDSRRTLPQLRDLIEERLGEPVSEGTLKALLARMTAPEVGILDSSRHKRPHGYGLTPSFRSLFHPEERNGSG
jgi:hypothetical protein